MEAESQPEKPLKPVYEEHPLKTSDSIRLLSFRADSKPGKINLQVRTVRLTDKPRYWALSYVWKLTLEGEKETVFIDDVPVDTHINLFNALQKAKGSDTIAGERFWVDFFCIDQDRAVNKDEKAAQVSMMPWIYSQAYAVVSWIGPGFEGDADACKLLAGFSSTDTSLPVPSDLKTEMAMAPWKKLAQFFSQKYFRRAWIIQELLNARESIIFMGEHEIKWLDIVTASDFISRSPWARRFHQPGFVPDPSLPSPFHGGPAKLQATRLEATRMDRSERNPGVKTQNLLYRLIRARRYECHSPQDKVWSIVGEAADPSVRPPHSLLKVDEHHTMEQVYTNAARYILESTEDLLLLAHCEGEDFHSPSLPSWVPDWGKAATLGLGITGYKRFSAAGSHLRELEILEDHPAEDSVTDRPPLGLPGFPRLRLSGLRLDTIAAAGGNKNRIRTDEGSSLEVFRGLEDTYAATAQKRLEVLWRTLSTDTDTDLPGKKSIHPAEPVMRVAFRQWLEERGPDDGEEAVRARVRDELLKEAQGDEYTVGDASINLLSAADRYDAALSHTPCLRLFRTRKGYLGVGSLSLKAGDDVWIVRGSRVPLIFRTEKSESQEMRTKLVGGAYVHGFMHGEALQSVEDASWEKIVVV